MTGLMNARKIVYNTFLWAVAIYSIWLILFKFAPDFTQIKIIWAGPIAGMVTLLFSALKIHDVMLIEDKNQNSGTYLKELISLYFSFYKKKSLLSILFIAVACYILYKIFGLGISICFAAGGLSILIGAAASAVISISSNIKLNSANSRDKAHRTAFNGGIAAYLIPLALGLIFLPVLYYIFKDANIISGFALGAAAVSMIYTACDGIFSKASSLASLQSEKLKEAEIIGSNTDAVDSALNSAVAQSAVIVSTMVLGSLVLNLIGAFIPLTLVAAGLFCTMIASPVVRTKGKWGAYPSIAAGSAFGIILFLAVSYYLIEMVFMGGYGIYASVVSGTLLAVILFISGSLSFREKKNAPDFINKIGTSAKSAGASFLPLALSGLFSIASFILTGGMDSYSSGFWGIGLTGISLLVSSGIIGASFGYAASCKNSSKIENCDDEKINEIYKAGKTICAVSKNMLSATSAIAALTALAAVAMTVNVEDVDLLNPFVMTFVLFGASIPVLAVGLINNSYLNNACRLVKKEFSSSREAVGFLSLRSAAGAVLPVLFSIILPVCVYTGVKFLFEKTLGIQSLGGALAGAIISAVLIALLGVGKDFAQDGSKTENAGDCSFASSNAALFVISLTVLTLSILLAP